MSVQLAGRYNLFPDILFVDTVSKTMYKTFLFRMYQFIILNFGID